MASAVTENLDKHFCCSVCLEKFNNPRVLSCLHTFCERCLEKLVECDDRPVFYCIIGQCGQPVEKRWMVRCPECRQITEVPSGQVQNLHANFFINNLMSSMELHREKQNIECDDCGTKDPPVVRCIDCSFFLCDFCSQSHRRRNITKGHKLMSLEEVKSCGPVALSKPSMCKAHESEPIKLYCQSCETTICRDCTMIDHRDHTYQFVKDVYIKEEAAVNQLLGKTKAKQSELEDALKGVVEMKTRVQRAGERVAQQINTSVDSLMESLKDRRNNLLQQAGEIEQGKLKELQAQQDELELALSFVTSGVEFTENALRDGSQVEVLSMKKQMTDRLWGLNTERSPLDICTDDLICYSVKPADVDIINKLGQVVDQYGTSPEKCVMKTEALLLQEETKITLLAKDQHGRPRTSGGDDVSVEIETCDGTQRVEVIDNGNGTYRASYTPRVAGVHRVFVKINGADIQKWGTKGSVERSTLQMEVGEPGVIYDTLINQTRDFTIVTRNSNDELIRELTDEITVKIREANSCNTNVIPVLDHGNGRYTFSYKPSSTGNYQVTVKINGDNVQGSPFTWGVESWHLVAKNKRNRSLVFRPFNRTMSATGKFEGNMGFSVGCHSWKIKIVKGVIHEIGVTDRDVKNTCYWYGGTKYHKVNYRYQSGNEQPSNISHFCEGDVCLAFLNLDKKQFTIFHLPSGQTDTWENVCARNSYLFPNYFLNGTFKFRL